MKLTFSKSLLLTIAALSLAVLTSCTGGSSTGGGSGTGGGETTIDPVTGEETATDANARVDASSIVYYPYETVFGSVCKTFQPTPGCTFSRKTGQRVTVSSDPAFDAGGIGSDNMWYVKFNSRGQASVYNDLGVFQYNANIKQFAGFIKGTTIGVGSSGAYWENVSNKTYWFGKNGVLYNANKSSINYGKAINTKDAAKASDMNSKAISSDINKKLIQSGAEVLAKQYGLSANKALSVASALNSWAVMGAERGKVTSKDMDQTFETVFGVKFNQALSAFKDFQNGDATGAREMTNRSATTLGLKPDQAKEFIKNMYKGAIEQQGYKADQVNW